MIAVAAMPGTDTGIITRQSAIDRRGAVDEGGLLELARHAGEVVVHDPDGQRQEARRVDQDDAQVGVHEVHVRHDAVERDQGRVDGQQQRGQHARRG